MNAIDPAPGEERLLDLLIEPVPLPAPAGDAVLVNRGSVPARVWRMGNSWGDRTLSFEITRDGRTVPVVLGPQEYTRNVPSSFEIPPGGRHAFPFDLRDGTWETGPAADLLAEGGADLVAVYELKPDQEALEQGCWTGQVTSAPVRLSGRP